MTRSFARFPALDHLLPLASRLKIASRLPTTVKTYTWRLITGCQTPSPNNTERPSIYSNARINEIRLH